MTVDLENKWEAMLSGVDPDKRRLAAALFEIQSSYLIHEQVSADEEDPALKYVFPIIARMVNNLLIAKLFHAQTILTPIAKVRALRRTYHAQAMKPPDLNLEEFEVEAANGVVVTTSIGFDELIPAAEEEAIKVIFDELARQYDIRILGSLRHHLAPFIVGAWASSGDMLYAAKANMYETTHVHSSWAVVGVDFFGNLETHVDFVYTEEPGLNACVGSIFGMNIYLCNWYPPKEALVGHLSDVVEDTGLIWCPYIMMKTATVKTNDFSVKSCFEAKFGRVNVDEQLFRRVVPS